jgi:predicted DNA-binding transcriptional regulator AlpA
LLILKISLPDMQKVEKNLSGLLRINSFKKKHKAPYNHRRERKMMSKQTEKQPTASFSPVSEYLKRREAASFLNLKQSTLEAWAVRGGGPPYIKMNRAVRYRLSDLRKWAEDNLCYNTSQRA